MELALPQLAQAVTVYEFLLVKVESGHLAKPVFPAVYKEFEELHKMVKKMCQDYLQSPGLCSQEPLEINDDKVAGSLGITEEFLRKKETHTECIPHTCTCQEIDREEPAAASPRKRQSEPAEEGLASVKRTRRAALPKELPESSACTQGQQKPPGCAPAASEGFIPRVNGDTCPCPENGHTPPGSEGDRSTAQAGQQLRALADLAARSQCADPALLYQDVRGLGLYTQPGQPGMLTQEQAAVFPTENAQGHSLDLTTGDSPGSQGLCSGLVSTGGVASLLPGGFGDTEVGKLPQVPGSHGSSQQFSPSEALLPGATAPLLEKVFSLHAEPTPCAGSTVSESGPQLGLDGLLSAEGGLRSHLVGLDQSACGTGTHNEQRELEGVIAVGETMAFEITSGCHRLLSQGQEQVFIQTPEGLTVPHPGAMVSGEDNVLLTEAEGLALQMGPAGGVPLETAGAEPPQ